MRGEGECFGRRLRWYFRRQQVDALVGATPFSGQVPDLDPSPGHPLRGAWDLARREELCELLGPLSGSITIDLRDVTYIDSTAIGVFVATRNRLVSEDGGLQLRVQDDDFVRRTLDVVGLSGWIVE
jgi:anti-anti-sigma factor